MTVARRPFEKRLAVGHILVCRIELTRLAITGHTITLEIAQMRLRPAHTLSDKDDRPQLDDAAARAERTMPVARSQDARDAGAAPDPAAVEATALAGFHPGALCGFHNPIEVSRLLAAAAHTAKAGFELIVAHSGVFPAERRSPTQRMALLRATSRSLAIEPQRPQKSAIPGGPVSRKKGESRKIR